MQVYSDHRSSAGAGPGAAPYLRARQLLNALALSLGDLLGLGLGLTLAAALHPALLDGDAPLWAGGMLVVWLLGAHALRLIPGWGVGPPDELRRLFSLTLMVYASTATELWLVLGYGGAELAWLGLGGAASWVLTALLRLAVRRLMVRAGLWGVPVVVYGGAPAGRLLVATLREHPTYGYRPVGLFDDAPRPAGLPPEVPVLGPTSGTAAGVPVAVVALDGAAREQVLALLEGPLRAYPRVVIVPDLFEVESLWMTTCDFSGVLGLEVRRPLLSPLARAAKRGLDLGCVLLAAPLWVPLCAVIALAIRLEGRAGALFLQPRVGLNGEVFTAWKFRTMRPGADELLRVTLEEDPELRREWETTFKLRRDPRITRLGALLRRTSLDELPQLMNVLRGQMSLVGPRPLPAYHHRELSRPAQLLRERVRPGMTGLWQVSGRSASGNAGMERWDPYYVRNWSPWLDLVIVLRTVQVVLRGTGAY